MTALLCLSSWCLVIVIVRGSWVGLRSDCGIF